MLKRLFFGFSMLLLTSCGMMASKTITVPTPLPTFASVQTQGTLIGGKQVDDLYVWLYTQSDSTALNKKELKVYVADANQQPISGAIISYDLDMINMSHGKNIVEASSGADGFYTGTATFVMPGPWRAIVTIVRPEKTSTLRFDFNVSYK
jgi:hypothetical protein